MEREPELNYIRTFHLTLTSKGHGKRRALWNCRVDGSYVVGAGSRPELALRDWKEQHRRWRLCNA